MTVIPIFIIVHNQYEILKRAVASYKAQIATPHEIIFHDVASTYYETLLYLEEMKEKGHKVYRSDINNHHSVLTSIRSYIAENPMCEYVVMTDPDIELHNVNSDILDIYIHTLNSLNKTSVGPMLEISDIPDYYPYKARATQSHRQQFWNKPRKHLHYKGHNYQYIECNTDTTFQLFRAKRIPPRFPHSNSIRFLEPYSAKHLDWYVNPYAITPCQLFYHLTTTNISHWNKLNNISIFQNTNIIKYVYYYNKCKCRNNYNFGDFITPFIYERLFGKKPILDIAGGVDKSDVVIGAGSILNSSKNNSVIWGTGFMFENQRISQPKKILSVRGPLTRNVLLKQGLQCPEMYGDIGLILPYFYYPHVKKTHEIGIIPHYVDQEIIKRMIKSVPDYIKIIDVTNPIEKVIVDILSCDRTMSSSLHGIIVSHAYNIPCMWIRLSNKIGGGNFKFRDYYGSVQLKDYETIVPINLTGEQECSKFSDLINNYPNPVFPIKTKHILKLCPFINVI